MNFLTSFRGTVISVHLQYNFWETFSEQKNWENENETYPRWNKVCLR